MRRILYGVDNRQQALNEILHLSEKDGYVTLDDILLVADKYSLPIHDVDWMSGTVASRGVLIYDSLPDKEDNLEEFDDYAQADYDLLFEEVLRQDESLELIIDYIRNLRPAQYREINQLKYQAAEGNQFAQERLFDIHLRAAVRNAKSRADAFDLNLSDTIQDAFIGLIIAIKKYKPDINGPFGSYASMWELRSITRAQETKRGAIYYPVHKKESHYAAYQILKENGCIECDEVWTCERLRNDLLKDISGGNVEDAIAASIPLESFDELVEIMGYDAESIAVQKMLDRISVEETGLDTVIEKDIADSVDTILSTLTKKEKEIIRLRYGFTNGKAMTLEEIGQQYGVTRERIRQIEAKAIKKLKGRNNRKLLKELL